ncbi:MAG: glucoamylase family protein, partial [Gemmatimonadaceae bacterium]
MNRDPLDPMLDDLQQRAFAYFAHETNPENGLVIDTTTVGAPSSIAAVGLGLTAYPPAVERGFMTRTEAAHRVLTTMRFFWGSKQGPEPDATGFRGFYYHFLDMQTGARTWNSELSTVDSALLIAGLLTAAAYFDEDNETENEIRELAERLYARVDWQWALNGGLTLTHGWKPESGFLPYRWQGYDEAMVLYVLALGSTTHAISSDSYTAWASTYEWRAVYETSYLFAGPLFIHQLSHVWIDFRGIRDAFMREHDLDYFENSRRATVVQQQYAVRNPQRWAGYGADCWGITACNGPGDIVLRLGDVAREFFGYLARGVPDGPDDGTVAPWGVIASLPFAPEIVLPTMTQLWRRRNDASLRYGLRTTYNPSFPSRDGSPDGWVSPYHCGLNQGPIVLMIENYRSGLIWNLLRANSHIVAGLRAAGFTGGWIEGSS